MTFVLSGEAAQLLWQTSLTPATKTDFPSPIRDYNHMKSKIQKQKKKATCTPGTSAETKLQRNVQKELQKTQLMNSLLQTFVHSTSPSKHTKKKATKRRHRKKSKKHFSSSSSSSSDNSNYSDTNSSD
ncbi:MAG: protein of unknown function DUF755 [Anelloviridae sp.]|nr:MAG: protein of unknown function DUF755 [Anelloviridae sp.]